MEPFGFEAGSHGSGGHLMQLLDGHVECGVQGEVVIDLYQRVLRTVSWHILTSKHEINSKWER